MTARWWAALAALSVFTISCGDDDGADPALPLVGQIAPAVEALEEELGDQPRYFEIRATPLAVTLWISADRGHRAIPYVYADGELANPGASHLVDSGFTFAAADALTFDPDDVLGEVVADVDSALTQFSIVGTERGDPRLTVTAASDRGGEFDIVIATDGRVLETLTAD